MWSAVPCWLHKLGMSHMSSRYSNKTLYTSCSRSFKGNMESEVLSRLRVRCLPCWPCHMVLVKEPAPGDLGAVWWQETHKHTHTHSFIEQQDRRGMQVSLWKCKNKMSTCKSDRHQMKEPISTIGIKNDPQTKQEGARRLICSPHRH